MAKLLLLELTNSSQFFGKSEYAMFKAQTEDSDIIECGLTYNSLTRRSFDTDDLDSLVGCTVITKEYEDSNTGELMNPEDQIQKILDGDARLVLLNTINSTVKKSELYRQEKKDMIALVNAKAKVEIQKEKKNKQLQASLDRILAKALVSVGPNLSTKEESFDDEEETIVDMKTSEETETVETESVTDELELGF